MERVRSSVRVWQVAATYMGAIIGAGFASGQELLRFFAVFGLQGGWGVLLAGGLFALLGATVVIFVNRAGVTSYQELTVMLFGEQIGRWLEVVISLILWLGLAVMLAGSGAIFAEHWKLNLGWGVSLTFIIVSGTLLFQSNGVKWLNSLLIPFLVLITVWISGKALAAAPSPQLMETAVVDYGLVGGNWMFASIIYVAYNMILGIVILASLDYKEEITGWSGALLGGLLLGLLGKVKVMALLVYYPQILQYQIPMLFIAGQQANWLKVLFTLALWSAMVTTAVANGFGITKRLVGMGGLTYNQALVLVLVSTLPLTRWQFSRLVAFFYPIFGYISLIIVVMIFIKMGLFLKKMAGKNKH